MPTPHENMALEAAEEIGLSSVTVRSPAEKSTTVIGYMDDKGNRKSVEIVWEGLGVDGAPTKERVMGEIRRLIQQNAAH